MSPRKPKAGGSPEHCSLCGGTELVDAVDNHGHAYRGCARCVVMLPPAARVAVPLGRFSLRKLVGVQRRVDRVAESGPDGAFSPEQLAIISYALGVLSTERLAAGERLTAEDDAAMAAALATDPPGDSPVELWREWCSRDITETDDGWATFTNRVHAMLERRGFKP